MPVMRFSVEGYKVGKANEVKKAYKAHGMLYLQKESGFHKIREEIIWKKQM